MDYGPQGRDPYSHESKTSHIGRPRNRGERRKRARVVRANAAYQNRVWRRHRDRPVWERDFTQKQVSRPPTNKTPSPQELGIQIASIIAERKLQHGSGAIESLRKDIPYWNPTFAKGTQVIEVLLYSNKVNVTTVASTAYATVQNITAALFNNFSDFAGIFDEYRMVGGKCNYYPALLTSVTGTTNPGTGFCVAAVDYGVSSAFASQDAAISHDNKQFFYLTAMVNQLLDQRRGVAEWKLELEPLPDEDWIPATTNNTVVAYWKPYMESGNSPGNFTIGFMTYQMRFQFRGLAA